VAASLQRGTLRSKVPSPPRALVALVDDDDGILRSLRSLLRAYGYGVATFSSAEAFLASDQRTESACLVLDLEMPGLGGLGLLAQLGAEGPRVVVLTARDHLREAALRAGAHAFLLKPTGADELVAAIEAVIAH
jgi:FixJ family two-component response regulator